MAKTVVDNHVKMKLLLEFEAAFPNEKARTVEEYLKGGGRSVILNVASFLLGFKNQKSQYANHKEALEMFFSEENVAFAQQVFARIKELEKSNRVQIFSVQSALELFETFFQKPEEKETQGKADFEVNMFKALLVLNSQYTEKQKMASQSTQGLDELEFPMKLFCMVYPISDKLNYNMQEQWVTQILKAIFLFEFLEENAKDLLAAFLSFFNCKTWQEYLTRLLPLTLSAVEDKKREAHTDIVIPKDKDFKQNCAFLEKLIVKESELFQEYDFLSLRARPFYKVEEGVYRIIFNLFVVEKIFKGVYFLLKEVNDKLQPPQKIKELKSFFGDEFSEKVLLYEILKVVYSNNCIAFSGKQLADMGINGAPDYYIREGRDIILYESKDFLIPAAVKDSFDYSQYENEFEKKLYFIDVNGTEKPKAVLQLINNVRRLLQTNFDADKKYNYREVCIYPVLITHDHQYEVPGFNSLLNYWFQAELEKLEHEGLFIRRVQPLVVVNIDVLIFHQIPLQIVHLHQMIKEYVDYIKIDSRVRFKTEEEAGNYLTSKQTPFSVFIDNEFAKRGLRQVPLEPLKKAGWKLFAEEKENTQKEADESNKVSA
jgi:hypothetical protein